MQEGYKSLGDGDDEQSNFAAKLKILDKGKKTIKREIFLNSLRLLFSARGKVLNNFKIRLFPIKNLDKNSNR